MNDQPQTCAVLDIADNKQHRVHNVDTVVDVSAPRVAYYAINRHETHRRRRRYSAYYMGRANNRLSVTCEDERQNLVRKKRNKLAVVNMEFRSRLQRKIEPAYNGGVDPHASLPPPTASPSLISQTIMFYTANCAKVRHLLE